MHIEQAAEFRFQQTKLSGCTVGKAYPILPPCRSNFENTASLHDNTLHTVKIHTWLNKKGGQQGTAALAHLNAALTLFAQP